MKSIIFNEQMVKSWLAGNITVTRSLMKPQPKFDPPKVQEMWNPPYLPGETVYIKEGWRFECSYAEIGEVSIQYRTDNQILRKEVPKQFLPLKIQNYKWFLWRPPMFMPEWAARSHARIVSVRPEHIRDITETEAKAEGVTPMLFDGKDFIGWEPTTDEQRLEWGGNYRDGFWYVWGWLYPGSWDRNDWVWVTSLEKLP